MTGMQREPGALRGNFDVLIVGGGVYGACIARLAARGGLRVALIERDDFGSGTSRNSLKIVHGGFRYIQHLDLARIRESVRAQRAWLRAAPHLVRPMRCVIPAYGHGARGPWVYAGGVLAYSLAAGRRNRGVGHRSRLPRSGVISRRRLAQAYPALGRGDLTGGAYWYDAQMLDAGRLTLECLQDACHHGAVVVNHVAALEPLIGSGRVVGASARDTLTGEEFEVRAKVTVNVAGAFAGDWLATPAVRLNVETSRIWTRNINIVTRRLFDTEDAVGVESRQPADSTVGKANRLFFVTPWRDCSIVGTSHTRHDAPAAELKSHVGADVRSFLAEARAALPGMDLGADDIRSVHSGLTPAENDGRAKRGLVIDHARTDGVAGLFTVLGIKYTTAPTVAEALLPGVAAAAGSSLRPADFGTPLPGVPATWPERGPWETAGAGEADWAAWTYGARWSELQTRAPRADVDEAEWVFRCRVRHGIEQEMVVRLTDAVYRASDLGERGLLDEPRIAWCLEEMSGRLGWSDARRATEMGNLRLRLQEDSMRLGETRAVAAA
jgi:glycerol-3-phosphate dehydrogenase